MKNGYIKLHRSLSDNDIWGAEPFTKGQAWIDLLMLANFKDGFIIKRGIKIDVLRGDIGMSEDELATRWKWSRGKVRRFIEYLDGQEMVQKIVQKIFSKIP
jgi:hypothetical protein